MITRETYQKLRDAYVRTRSVSRSARIAEVTRKTARRYIEEGAHGFPAIKSVVIATENLNVERYAAVQASMTDTVLDAAQKLRISPRGKKNRDGTLSVSPCEFHRVQKIMREAIELSDILSVDGNKKKCTNESTEAARRHKEQIEQWISIDRQFLTPDEMISVTPYERAQLVAKRSLISLLRKERQLALIRKNKNVHEVLEE